MQTAYLIVSNIFVWWFVWAFCGSILYSLYHVLEHRASRRPKLWRLRISDVLKRLTCYLDKHFDFLYVPIMCSVAPFFALLGLLELTIHYALTRIHPPSAPDALA